MQIAARHTSYMISARLLFCSKKTIVLPSTISWCSNKVFHIYSKSVFSINCYLGKNIKQYSEPFGTYSKYFINSISPSLAATIDFNKFRKYHSISNLFIPEISNSSDIETAIVKLQNLITNSQKHITFYKFKNNTTFIFPAPFKKTIFHGVSFCLLVTLPLKSLLINFTIRSKIYSSNKEKT